MVLTNCQLHVGGGQITLSRGCSAYGEEHLLRVWRRSESERAIPPDSQGIDILDLREWTKKRQQEDTNSITEMDNSPIVVLSSSSENGERKSSSEPPQVEETAGKAKAKPKTTVMLRNLPNNYTRSMLLHLLDEQGFGGPTWAMPSSTWWTRRTWMNFGTVSMALGLGPFPLLRFAK